jgi:hypothetical protein
MLSGTMQATVKQSFSMPLIAPNIASLYYSIVPEKCLIAL